MSPELANLSQNGLVKQGINFWSQQENQGVVNGKPAIGLPNTVDQLSQFLNTLTPEIGRFGGRHFIRENDEKKYKLKDLVKKLNQMACAPSNNPDHKEKVKTAVKAIRGLDQRGDKLLSKAGRFRKVTTAIRRFVGNLFYNKNKVLDHLQFDGKTPITYRGKYKVLKSRGDGGTIETRLYGIVGGLLPKLSLDRHFEFKYRTHLRLRNLIAVRGNEEGARMIGPCDYYGNLEKSHQYEYTIQIDDGVPVFFHTKKNQNAVQSQNEGNVKKPDAPSTRIRAEWCSGRDVNANQDLNAPVDQQLHGESLFNTKGVLKMSGGDHFELKKFDAREVDLSPYKARLVKNDTPFQISQTKLHQYDDYRVITYLYEQQYADRQVKHGGGLFLETHSFAQTMTPLDDNSGGFVTLGKWSDEQKTHLELIGVEIPFGYTLVVEENSIHGDTDLDGTFAMCMTANHETMKEADTVFLKNAETMKNVKLTIEGGHKTSSKDFVGGAPRPLVTFNE